MKRFKQKQMIEVRGAMNRRVLYSYDEPVVVVDGSNYFVTQEYFSKTTTKHINLYLREEKAQSIHRVDSRIFPKLVSGEI